MSSKIPLQRRGWGIIYLRRKRSQSVIGLYREYQRGKYHRTIDLLFDWFGLVCFATKNKNCHLSYSWFQTSKTGGEWYSDTSSFKFPGLYLCIPF